MTKTFALASALLALGTASALAGGLNDPITETVPVAAPVAAAPVSNWSGFYAGGQLGFADLEIEDGGFDDDDDGAFGGVHLGWQTALGQWVLGAELDSNVTDIELEGEDLDALAHLKARLGYDLGNALVYATGGAAFADLGDIGDDAGYAIGLGYDYLISDNFSVGAEALYNVFDDFDDTGADIEGATVGLKASFHF